MDIYDFINKYFKQTTNPIRFSTIFNDNLKKITDEEELKFIEYLKKYKIFRLFQNLSHIYLKTDEVSHEILYLTTIIGNGFRTYMIKDISESDLDLLEQINFDLLSLSLKAFVAHIITKRKNFINSEYYTKLAINSYIELLNLINKDNKSNYSIFEIRDMIIFVLNLANTLVNQKERDNYFHIIGEYIDNEITNDTLINELTPIRRKYYL